MEARKHCVACGCRLVYKATGGGPSGEPFAMECVHCRGTVWETLVKVPDGDTASMHQLAYWALHDLVLQPEPLRSQLYGRVIDALLLLWLRLQDGRLLSLPEVSEDLLERLEAAIERQLQCPPTVELRLPAGEIPPAMAAAIAAHGLSSAHDLGRRTAERGNQLMSWERALYILQRGVLRDGSNRVDAGSVAVELLADLKDGGLPGVSLSGRLALVQMARDGNAAAQAELRRWLEQERATQERAAQGALSAAVDRLEAEAAKEQAAMGVCDEGGAGVVAGLRRAVELVQNQAAGAPEKPDGGGGAGAHLDD